MKLDQRTGPMLLAGAVLLGLVAQWLFDAETIGLNLVLWLGAVLGLFFWLQRGQAREGLWLPLVAVVFSLGQLWRDSPMLRFLDGLAILLCLGLAVVYTHHGQLRRSGVMAYAIGLTTAGLQVLAGPLPLLFSDIDWKAMPKGRRSTQVGAVLRGLLIALPFLLLFGALFTAADPVFATLMGDLFRIDLGRLIGRLFASAAWAWLAAGLVRSLLVGGPDLEPGLPKQGRFTLGAIETGIIFGMLGGLFLAFVLVQFRYFFGGAPLVEASTGWTYAEYARRGFFELVAVSVLLLPVLLVGHWLQPVAAPGQQRLFRWLALALVGNLAVIMTSAVQRMLLYQREFGLSELRVYTIAFMLWLALLFGWFVLTVLREQRERFAFGALVSGLALLVGLHLLNPDVLIARSNLARLAAGYSFDAEYAGLLSADAVPVLLETLPDLPEAEREILTHRLRLRFTPPEQPDWRSWNLSRVQAWRAMAAKGFHEYVGANPFFEKARDIVQQDLVTSPTFRQNPALDPGTLQIGRVIPLEGTWFEAGVVPPRWQVLVLLPVGDLFATYWIDSTSGGVYSLEITPLGYEILGPKLPVLIQEEPKRVFHRGETPLPQVLRFTVNSGQTLSVALTEEAGSVSLVASLDGKTIYEATDGVEQLEEVYVGQMAAGGPGELVMTRRRDCQFLRFQMITLRDGHWQVVIDRPDMADGYVVGTDCGLTAGDSRLPA